MNKKIHSLVYSLFSKIHIYPAKLTPQEDFVKLIKKLRPVNTDKPLIRLGPKGDGGYLIPDDLEGIMACFSPGVDKICGFEKDCAEKGIKVFMADYSVNKPPEENIHFNFNKKFIGLHKSFEFLSMDEWVKENSLDSKSDLMLQMDIEGFEYEAFFGMSQSLLQRFRIIIVEFHFLNKLFIQPYFELVSKIFDYILNTHYCLHIHPNNINGIEKINKIEIPHTAEFTFLRKDRVKNIGFVEEFPNELDYDNIKSKPTLVLPDIWFKY